MPVHRSLHERPLVRERNQRLHQLLDGLTAHAKPDFVLPPINDDAEDASPGGLFE
jgi:hypothetical protein